MSDSLEETRVLSAAELRLEISARNHARGQQHSHEISWGPSKSVLFEDIGGSHGNFLPRSFARINNNAAWRKRLTKSYTASRFLPRAYDRRRFELDCATSSDALLMNIFCYPRVLTHRPLCALLGIEPGLSPEFGFRPVIPLANEHIDRTEIDVRLGHLLIEAKLTEADFQRAPLRLLSRYRYLNEVFNLEELPVRNNVVYSWQLIRGVLAAHATGNSFFLFCDRRRPDLIDRWFGVMRAVVDCSLRTRLGILTWQEISVTLPKPLRAFLDEKYGI